MSDDVEQSLLKAFRQMTPTARSTLVDFADFLSQRHPVAATPASEQPLQVPRPTEESVIAAIRRLAKTYPMLDSDNVFSAATTLMTRHVMGQQAAVEVIDELEVMFKARYDDLYRDA